MIKSLPQVVFHIEVLHPKNMPLITCQNSQDGLVKEKNDTNTENHHLPDHSWVHIFVPTHLGDHRSPVPPVTSLKAPDALVLHLHAPGASVATEGIAVLPKVEMKTTEARESPLGEPVGTGFDQVHKYKHTNEVPLIETRAEWSMWQFGFLCWIWHG